MSYEFVTRSFRRALEKASPVIGKSNVAGTELYRYQVEFSYLIDELQRGPEYIAQKTLAEIDDLINELNQKTNG